MFKTKKQATFIIVLGGIVLAGCSLSGNSTPAPAGTSTESGVSEAAVEIKDFKFNPATLTAKPGQQVTIVNRDLSGHSLTSDDGLFDTGVLSQGESKTITAPTNPGTYKMHCILHPSITGTLVVQ